jgi:Tfp pilus assembly protein PilF
MLSSSLLLLFLAAPAAAAELPPPVATVREALDAERWDEAIAAGESAVKELPESAVAHLWLGKAYGQKAIRASLFTQLGWAKKCRTEFEKAVALDPKSAEARGDLVQYYADAPGIAGGGIDKAKEQVRAIEALDPARGALMNGYVLAHEKKTAEAEAEFRRALTLRPDDPYFHWRFGYFLEKAGRALEAKAAYTESLRLDPSYVRAKKALARLGG